MVNKLSKIFAYSMFFILALMYFVPKLSIYYLVEQEIQKYGIVIDNEEVIDNGFSLSIQNAEINVKSINSASIKNVNIKIFGVYNNVLLQNIKLSSVAASMVPTDIEEVEITHSLFNPLHISAVANGGFGELEVDFDLLDMTLHLELLASKKMLSSYRGILRNLKKNKEGVYIYDKTIKY